MRKNHAFTLVELLVVIIIIGIIASVLVVSVGKGADKAEAIKILSDMRMVKSAILMDKAERGVWSDIAVNLSGGGGSNGYWYDDAPDINPWMAYLKKDYQEYIIKKYLDKPLNPKYSVSQNRGPTEKDCWVLTYDRNGKVSKGALFLCIYGAPKPANLALGSTMSKGVWNEIRKLGDSVNLYQYFLDPINSKSNPNYGGGIFMRIY